MDIARPFVKGIFAGPDQDLGTVSDLALRPRIDLFQAVAEHNKIRQHHSGRSSSDIVDIVICFALYFVDQITIDTDLKSLPKFPLKLW